MCVFAYYHSLFCLVAVYLIGGVLYMRLVQKAKGLNQIPNYSFWKDFGALQAVSLFTYLFIYLFICIYFLGMVLIVKNF